MKLLNAAHTVGLAITSEGENIYLAERIWKIVGVEATARKIEVVPACDGRKPVFGGTSAIVNGRIREKMLEILLADDEDETLNAAGKDELNRLRKDFGVFNIEDLQIERPLLKKRLRRLESKLH